MAAGMTDRAWIYGLERHGANGLQENPFSGHVLCSVFRGRRGALIKMLLWGGDGPMVVQSLLHENPQYLFEPRRSFIHGPRTVSSVLTRKAGGAQKRPALPDSGCGV